MEKGMTRCGRGGEGDEGGQDEVIMVARQCIYLPLQ